MFNSSRDNLWIRENYLPKVSLIKESEYRKHKKFKNNYPPQQSLITNCDSIIKFSLAKDGVL